MQILNKHEMLKISGGGLSLGAVFGIGSLLTFLAGIIDGIARPLKCR